MRLETPEGFPTAVHVEAEPAAALLPQGPWVLAGDRAVQATWRRFALPEPPGSLWLETCEAGKRLEGLLPLLEAWASRGLHRDATVVAVGGGVLTDMAGLAAALYVRGLAWHAWPTTLLGQVDAALGGKTAVNLPQGKNLAGVFHAPERLVACRAFLDTLPPRHLEAGFWELLKSALVAGDLAWAEALLARPPVEADLAGALRLKAAVVHRDPFERGERRLLNLGHTLGHALEAAGNHALLHGEAVGLGLLAALFLAESRGLAPFPPAFVEALRARLRPLAPLLPPFADCRAFLARDKKAHAGPPGSPSAVHCILPRPGQAPLQEALPPEAWASPHARLRAFLA